MKSASSVFLRLLRDATRGTNVDLDAVLHDAGVVPSILDQPDGRLSLEAARQAWDLAGVRSSDECFGLHAAERLGETRFELVEYLARTSATVGDALQSVEAFGGLISEGSDVTVEHRGRFAWLLDRGPGPRHFVDLFLATLHLRLRALSDGKHGLVRVIFQHGGPADPGEYARIFAVPVAFGGPANAMVFARALLKTPLQTADQNLRAILERHALELLARTPRSSDLAASVRAELTRDLAERRESRIETVAQRLRSSPRTLQRRLESLGTSFQQLLDEARHTLALHLIGACHAQAGEAAAALGFADATTFHRAFRRWTGSTPAQYAALHTPHT